MSRLSQFLVDLTQRQSVLGPTWSIVRLLVAGGPLLTLMTNAPETISPIAGAPDSIGKCDGIGASALTCLVEGGSYGWLSQAFFIAGFALVASGLVPVLTGPLHYYLAWSWIAVLSTTDGGDQTALVFAFWAMPICLVDWRWHTWSAPVARSRLSELRNSTESVFLTVLRIQIAFIYLISAVFKFGEETWADGTSVYYWIHSPYFARPDWVTHLANGLADVPTLMLLMTWGAIALELALAVSLFLSAKVRLPLFIAAVSFHAAIAVLFGIVTFSLTMTAMLLTLLGPLWAAPWAWVQWRARRPSATAAASAASAGLRSDTENSDPSESPRASTGPEPVMSALPLEPTR